VPVSEVGGHLTDHYDPTKRALCLSSENFHGRSIAAVGVAAHEAGHALQHQAAYGPLHLRMTLVPVTQFASYAWIGIMLLGMFLASTKLIWVAIAVFSVTMLFSLVTLPVEYDASRRAKEHLLRLGIVRAEESDGVNKVLGAAALTYVAALVSSVMQLLYFLSMARNSRD
jgi:Zn-dependent membrane protease YugP